MFSVAGIVSQLLNLLVLAIFLRAILSWFMQVGRDPITRFLVDITEPLLAPIRRLISNLIPGVGIDLSPIIAIVLIQVLAGMVARAM